MRIPEKDKLIEHQPEGGQLADAEADMYVVPRDRQARVRSIIVANTSAVTTNTVSVYMKTSAGTSRRIFHAALSPGDTAYLDEMVLAPGAAIRGYATNANQVDWAIMSEEEWSL